MADIVTEINRIKSKVQESYVVAASKNALIPAQQNLNNLPDCINSINNNLEYFRQEWQTYYPTLHNARTIIEANESAERPTSVCHVFFGDVTSVSIPAGAALAILADGSTIVNPSGTINLPAVDDYNTSFILLQYVNPNVVVTSLSNNTHNVCVSNATVQIGGYSSTNIVTFQLIDSTISFTANAFDNSNLVNWIDENCVYGAIGVTAIFRNCSNLLKLKIGVTELNASNFASVGASNLYIILPLLTKITVSDSFSNNPLLISIHMPQLTEWTGIQTFFSNMWNLTSVTVGTLTAFTPNGQFAGCTKLKKLIIGSGTDIALNFNTWNPTVILASNVLKAQLVANIKTGIADKVKDNTSLTAKTITFRSDVREAIRGSAAESTLVAKNWNISPA